LTRFGFALRLNYSLIILYYFKYSSRL
jgi:hypothetical protein